MYLAHNIYIYIIARTTTFDGGGVETYCFELLMALIF